MNKLINYLQKGLLLGLPVALIWITIIYLPKSILNGISHISPVVMTVFTLIFMTWLGLLLVFLTLLIVAPSMRDRILRRLANLKERDEREQYITGKASRTAYISTLSLMLLLLFLSMFNISLYKYPESKHPYTFGMNFYFTIFHQNTTHDPRAQAIFDSSDYSLSTSAVLFILLGWQLLAYNMTARKEQLND